MSKKDESLEAWVEKETKTKDKSMFLSNHLIPDVSLKLEGFDEFIIERTQILKEKLKSLLA